VWGREGAACVPEDSLRKIASSIETPAVTQPPPVYWEREVLLVRHLDEARCTLTPSDPSSAVGGSVVQAASEPAALAKRIWPLLLRAWGRRPLPAAVEQQRSAHDHL